MKLLGLLLFALLLALLLPPVGCGARQRASGCPPARRLVPVRVVRSRRAAQAPKTVRTIRPAIN